MKRLVIVALVLLFVCVGCKTHTHYEAEQVVKEHIVSKDHSYFEKIPNEIYLCEVIEENMRWFVFVFVLFLFFGFLGILYIADRLRDIAISLDNLNGKVKEIKK